MAEQYKRRRGDRRDGRLLRELDSPALHYGHYLPGTAAIMRLTLGCGWT